MRFIPRQRPAFPSEFGKTLMHLQGHRAKDRAVVNRDENGGDGDSRRNVDKVCGKTLI